MKNLQNHNSFGPKKIKKKNNNKLQVFPTLKNILFKRSNK